MVNFEEFPELWLVQGNILTLILDLIVTLSCGWHNPNGTLLNGISAVLLIISYSSASVIICQDKSSNSLFPLIPQGGPIAIAGIPLLILGITLLLQLTPATFQCMHHVSDIDMYGGSVKPPEIQPSTWHAHPSIQKVDIFLWVIVAAYAGWAALIMYTSGHLFANESSRNIPLTLQMWSFFQNLDGNDILYVLLSGSLKGWTLVFVNIAVVQGPLTLGLHCSELIVNPFLCSYLLLHGPQPAAYGHLQMLANLMDEWSPVMWWGHKEDGIPL
ncbi:hypothetical protein BDR06DRAFT_972255 [Suillus hirtellus]|nr:hypothetical protein BDR06DRAFT_972255 [Suillus hirtellus]